ncbi:MAG: hypothetical protein RL748_3965 [Pseudomonadota bacterium]|jgi:superfamily II DNA/RNA helicase
MHKGKPLIHAPALTPHQSQYYAWLLTRRTAGDSVEDFAATLVDSQVNITPHQVDAALFACKNPLSKGVILADEVGLGKTIEAGLVILQRWAERRRRILIIVPANLRKQWHQELLDKFGLHPLILEAQNYNNRAQTCANPFEYEAGPVICSYQFTKAKAKDISQISWDLVVMDEAHRLRNVYKPSNIIAATIRDALAHVRSKVLLTATPLQNSLLELYGLVSMVDDQVFGDMNSFRSQFMLPTKTQDFSALRTRLAPICKRTLRKDVVQYVPYTKRISFVQSFTPSSDERELNTMVGQYLSRPHLQALPAGQRQLVSLVLWKLLASSSHAIAGALATMAKRLQTQLAEGVIQADAPEQVLDDFDGRDDLLDERGAEFDSNFQQTLSLEEYDAIAHELEELRHFEKLAASIRDNGKGKVLMQALETGFAKMAQLEAPQKAIIFTESKRTQQYLLELLAETPYGKGVVLFNGTNSDAQAGNIYKAWAKRHAGTDRISGSKSADTRAALVEYFAEQGSIMIATEAGAEGINLQFCSLVINYDLPWNPQRIEQRIGRCHRYGQQYDVVVINFVDAENVADRRVFELLREKFQLFDGVFGASDEILGAIGAGVDFERRIADIYQEQYRHPETINASFDKLRAELAGEINATMLKTRQALLENFDESVQNRLRLQEQEGVKARDRYAEMLLKMSCHELGQHASATERGFELHSIPDPALKDIATGHYELPHLNREAHMYRLSHPLAQWASAQARTRHNPMARLRFDYDAFVAQNGAHLSALQLRRGQAGWLCVRLITILALEREVQNLLVAACTFDGSVLQENDPQRLLDFPAQVLPCQASDAMPDALTSDLAQRREAILAQTNQTNLGYFNQEVEKLDAWADDQKVALEQAIKEIDRQIKEVRRTAAMAPTLEEKLHWQKQQRDMETRRSKLRRDLFDQQDQIEARRNELISTLELQLQQHLQEQTLFIIEWELV